MMSAAVPDLDISIAAGILGRKGGKAGREALTAEERSASAKNAADARWRKRRQELEEEADVDDE
jgi:hypothetical protein